MKRQRMAMFGGLLAAAVAVMVTGVAARSDQRQEQGDRRNRAVVEPNDRRVIRLDGRGSQLGVMVSDSDDAAKPGVRIDGVDDGSAAAKAGAKPGDVVVEFDGERVRSARQLTRLVQETPSGRTVKMTVLRGAARQTLDVTPEAAESAWSMQFEPGLRADVDRGVGGRREMSPMPRMAPPALDFRFDGMPGLPLMEGRGRLGVQVEGLSDQLASYFGATSGGVLVSSVTKESPAEKAGLKAGDVITAVNGKSVRDAGDLVDELSDVKDGTEVSLGVLRDRKATTLKATIEAPRRTPARRSTRPA